MISPLVRPLGIEANAWTAIVGHRDRLDEATQGADRSLVLGRAKELAESVARVVITQRGQVAPAATDFPVHIDSAHGVLKRQPGTDLSNDTELRNLVQSAMKIVKSVGTIRNSFGSGHGRAREPQVKKKWSTLLLQRRCSGCAGPWARRAQRDSRADDRDRPWRWRRGWRPGADRRVVGDSGVHRADGGLAPARSCARLPPPPKISRVGTPDRLDQRQDFFSHGVKLFAARQTLTRLCCTSGGHPNTQSRRVSV